MLGQGIIHPSHSPWMSPIVLVAKPDGSLWFFMDYQNALTTVDAFPMSHTAHLLERIGEAKFITTIDLFKGY